MKTGLTFFGSNEKTMNKVVTTIRKMSCVGFDNSGKSYFDYYVSGKENPQGENLDVIRSLLNILTRSDSWWYGLFCETQKHELFQKRMAPNWTFLSENLISELKRVLAVL